MHFPQITRRKSAQFEDCIEKNIKTLMDMYMQKKRKKKQEQKETFFQLV